MGLKLKWFRRRITFDGIPSAPERDIRRKEATAGTVIGVYRQSAHFEDYIEPVRSSYWEPPPQAIARATIRSNGNLPTTSTNSPSNSYSSSSSTLRARVTAQRASRAPQVPVPAPTGISSVSRPPSMGNVVMESDSHDKIVRPPVERLQLNADYDTPPEPNYAAPKPPARKGVSKAKSMGNLTNGNDSRLEDANNTIHYGEEIHELRSPQSVEVLSDPYVRTAAPSPPPSPIHVVPIAPIPRSTSSNSLPTREIVPEPIYPVKPEVSTEPEYIVPLASEEPVDEPIYDSFNVLFERVNIRTPDSPGSERSNTSTRPETSSPLPARVTLIRAEDDAIFERVNISNYPTRDSQQSTSTRTQPSSSSPSPSPSASPSPSPSPPPRQKPILKVTSVPVPPTSPPQPKSILKKRAPPPPQTPVEATSSMVEFTNEEFQTIPTPPPRSIRVTTKNDSPATPSPITPTEQNKNVFPTVDNQTPIAMSNGKDPDSDSDDDFNWDFVQKHRSSINQTVAAQTQIDPDVLRNAPASLRAGMTQAVPSPRNLPEPIAQPRTLRGMRNQRVHAQLENASANTPAVQIPPPRARASDSNASETSA
ncbi:proteoglycan 4-like [Anopheles marshallii]|uniref:proteoglycan 4-like n=1 Tax=Anopheles marshallii TaxID=1521116 RepID=UPI00237B6E99|nr:proteoglycan 4-like [Anopheles marshallii]